MPAAKAEPPNVAALAQEALKGGASVASLLASRLRDEISKGVHAVGSALPAERALMAQHRVSRATVREALRILSAQDLVKARRGRTGGSFVSPPGAPLGRALEQLVEGGGASEVAAVRRAIEPAAAAQAALSRTEAHLETLRLAALACEGALERYPDFVEADLRWRLAMAEASGNRLFIALISSLSTVVREDLGEHDTRLRKAVMGAHWQVYDAIRQGDAEAARRRVQRRLSATVQALA